MTELHFCKPIPNFDGYFASKLGSIFSVNKSVNGEMKCLKLSISCHGYYTLKLGPKSKSVHTLIASTWLQNLNKLLVVNHKDGNKLNNHVDNLEYITRSENTLHSVHVLGNKRTNQKAVCQVAHNGTLIAEFDSITMAHNATGINGSTISFACNGRTKTAGGFMWTYKEDYKGEPITTDIPNTKPVQQCDLLGNVIQEFSSVKGAAEFVGAHAQNISNACNGKLKSCKGYTWKYAIKPKPVPIKDPTEDWVILEDYPMYKISRDGQIFSIWLKKMKKNIDRGGYKSSYMIDSNKKGHTMYVHRAVAMAYIPNPNNYKIINHKDGDPSNNVVENLEWCTYEQNSQHAYDTGLNTSLRSVIQMDEEDNIINIFKSIKEAAEITGINRSCISSVCRGVYKNKITGGYRWKYA